MQGYVNVDYRNAMSIVGVVDEAGAERVIAEGRYVRLKDRPYADLAFVVDEACQGKGIASFLLGMLIRIAREQGGIEGFTADILADNKAMMKVLEKGPYPVQAVLSSGSYELTIPFTDADGDDDRHAQDQP
jgi:RimJ/RimL family protein N-acetyltransferase